MYDISIQNQDELILKTIIVSNKDEKQEYTDTKQHHAVWNELIKKEQEKTSSTKCMVITEEGNSVYLENRSNTQVKNEMLLKNCLEITKNRRKFKKFPLNFILYGAPGTGKTYSMLEYALAIVDGIPLEQFKQNNSNRQKNVNRYKQLINEGQVVFTTFHQNYGYEEFIQGIRPQSTNGEMSFELTDGIFKRIADKAMNDKDNKNYVIIIDEINRANISKVFGELITLIEEEKRWGEIDETCITLQSGDIFAVPNNLYIIGTMNSADKSISLIDAALRRRFEFVEKKPELDLIRDNTLKQILESLNNNLVEELESTDLLIGHSYFINKTTDDLCIILNNKIIPLLYEYFYDNKKKVYRLVQDAVQLANGKITIVDDKFGRLRVKE